MFGYTSSVPLGLAGIAKRAFQTSPGHKSQSLRFSRFSFLLPRPQRCNTVRYHSGSHPVAPPKWRELSTNQWRTRRKTRIPTCFSRLVWLSSKCHYFSSYWGPNEPKSWYLKLSIGYSWDSDLSLQIFDSVCCGPLWSRMASSTERTRQAQAIWFYFLRQEMICITQGLYKCCPLLAVEWCYGEGGEGRCERDWGLGRRGEVGCEMTRLKNEKNWETIKMKGAIRKNWWVKSFAVWIEVKSWDSARGRWGRLGGKGECTCTSTAC